MTAQQTKVGISLSSISNETHGLSLFPSENKGQSAARNLALQHATGKYIYMMDSDDMLSSPDAFQVCYDYAEQNQADFIFFDRDWFADDGLIATSGVHSTQYVEENTRYNGETLLNHMLDTVSYNSVVWLLFINHEHLKRIGLTFYEGIIHEDEPVHNHTDVKKPFNLLFKA